MKVHYTGRHAEISESEKNRAKRKLEKIHRILGSRRELEAHVILSKQRNFCEAEVTLNALQHTLVVTATNAQPFSALLGALEKLEKQAKKEKTKVVVRNRPLRQRGEIPAAVAMAGGEASMAEEEAAPAAGGIIRGNGILPKPATVEEARLHLESEDRDQVTFRDVDSGAVCVLLRRRDGALELVEAGV